LDPLGWPRLVVMGVFLFGLIYDNNLQLQGRLHAPPNQPSLELLQISHAIDGPGGIIAPWWLSPGLLYFSGQPIVSGSSHCGISGIVASAQFFASGSWVDAEHILQARKVRWIVVWDDPQLLYPLLDNSRQILGLPAYSDDDANLAEATVTQVLVEDHDDVPTWLRLRGVTPHLKLYEYLPDGK
jgi:hypothetical protein